MSSLVNVAGAQIDVAWGDPKTNLARIQSVMEKNSREGVLLTVFPECAVSGYCFDSLEEARPFASPIPGPATDELVAIAQKSGSYLVAGMLESDGDRIFNAAVLVGPNGLIGSYRKIHLPYLGIDRFATPGDRPFRVFEVGPLRVGMHICYDGSFPESARVMAVQGADLIVLPTNWPPKSECAAAHLANVRAHENNIYYLCVNRVGEERGFAFIGGSKICDPSGETIAEAPGTQEQIMVATIDVERARRKRLIRVPGLHEINRIADRRPEMYQPLVEPIDAGPNSRESATADPSTMHPKP
jgi:5-aminopentanamidase